MLTGAFGQTNIPPLTIEQYNILNSFLKENTLLYHKTNFSYHWQHYLNLNWLKNDIGFCLYEESGVSKNEISRFVDETTLENINIKIDNIQGPYRIEEGKINKTSIKLVSEYNSNNILYLSSPIIERGTAVILYKKLWEEKIIFFLKSEDGQWNTFCEFYIKESTRTNGISYFLPPK